MAPILTSMEVPVGYTAVIIKSFPSFGYELLFGNSLAKVSHVGREVFYV